MPFVAGAGTMTYSMFALYNVTGAVIWVGICTLAGYAFGQVPIVKENFTLVALGIVFVSLLPIAIEMIRHRRGSSPPLTPDRTKAAQAFCTGLRCNCERDAQRTIGRDGQRPPGVHMGMSTTNADSKCRQPAAASLCEWLVDGGRIELPTSALRTRRSPS